MLDDPIKYGLLAALAIALLVAAVTDLRHRQIGNWLTAGIAVTAPLFWLAVGMPLLWPETPLMAGGTSVAAQFGVALATFTILAGLFAIKAMGGGDVKLLTALALWIRPEAFLYLLIFMALIGGLLTIVFGAWHVMRRQREKLAVPYGVAIALAGIWTLGVKYLPDTAAGGGLG